LADPPVEAVEIRAEFTSQFSSDQPRYLIPLLLDSGLVGVVVVGVPEVEHDLSWEDYDVLKLVSRQCAGFLALERLNNDLREQQQLNAMTQVSAFLVHDVKTIAAQLSLMLDNATQHKTNPAFVDDMISTSGNAVRRLEHIISELRQSNSAARDESSAVRSFDIVELVAAQHDTLADPRGLVKAPVNTAPIFVVADPVRVANALTHLIKNAMDAVGEEGRVELSVYHVDGWGVVEIVDNGVGMSAEFIANDLFAPFRTSKGISGMGIGAYQAREHIRDCGGDLHVNSKLGLGTTFRVKLPLVDK
jgi:putative PEP-CTERM system histidine kinase